MPRGKPPASERAAIDYYRLTGKPRGITGELGEYEATRLLGLILADARAPGYDATDKSGRRYQIKARAFSEAGRRKSQRLGSIKLDHEWEAVLLVLMDESLQTLEIWEADRSAVADALTAPGSKARNEWGLGGIEIQTDRKAGVAHIAAYKETQHQGY